MRRLLPEKTDEVPLRTSFAFSFFLETLVQNIFQQDTYMKHLPLRESLCYQDLASLFRDHQRCRARDGSFGHRAGSLKMQTTVTAFAHSFLEMHLNEVSRPVYGTGTTKYPGGKLFLRFFVSE